MVLKFLFGLVCLFGGLIVGFVFSPVKKGIALGSHNGCNNGNGNEGCLCEEEEEQVSVKSVEEIKNFPKNFVTMTR